MFIVIVSLLDILIYWLETDCYTLWRRHPEQNGTASIFLISGLTGIQANLLLRSIRIAMYEAGSAAPKPDDQE